jgi:hypothetical protein
MTPDEIKSRIDLDDATVTLSDNGAWYWIRLERKHAGQTYRHTVKLDLDPSESQILDAGDTLRLWWSESIAGISET